LQAESTRQKLALAGWLPYIAYKQAGTAYKLSLRNSHSARGVYMSNNRRCAFTLVEVLITVTIILLLISVLLPAVQVAREAARRSSCMNNLKQISLGVHNYVDSFGRMPTGYLVGDKPEPSWGWPVFLLPHIEHQQLHLNLSPDNRTLNEVLQASGERVLLATDLSPFVCPSSSTYDADEEITWARGDVARQNKLLAGLKLSATSYTGNRGFYNKGGSADTHGVFFGNSKVRFADIIDGESNTFMLGERIAYCQRGSWAGVANPLDAADTYSCLSRVSVPLNSTQQSGAASCAEGFGSDHPGGAVFASCNGAVHFVSNKIEFSNGGLDQTQIASGADFDAARLGVYQLYGIRDDLQMTVDFENPAALPPTANR